MRTLEFTARGQRLRHEPDGAPPVAMSEGYLQAHFRLGPEWGGMAVAASFFGADGIEHAAMLDESGCCMVPAEALTGRRFDVGLTGVSAGEKRATNTVAVYQREAMR